MRIIQAVALAALGAILGGMVTLQYDARKTTERQASMQIQIIEAQSNLKICQATAQQQINERDAELARWRAIAPMAPTPELLKAGIEQLEQNKSNGWQEAGKTLQELNSCELAAKRLAAEQQAGQLSPGAQIALGLLKAFLK